MASAQPNLHVVHPKEPELYWDFPALPHIEPGDYPAISRTSSIYRDPQFKRWVCAVQFDIMSESLMNVVCRLTWYLNLGNEDRPKIRKRGNYRQAWVQANGRQPGRGDRISGKVFEHRAARVQVADTVQSFNRSRISPAEAYSVIREVLRWETGGGRS